MVRYRCPNCPQLLQSQELRIGKPSTCPACLGVHTVPADRADWLTESGEPLSPSPQPAKPELARAAVGGGDDSGGTPAPADPTPTPRPLARAVAGAAGAEAGAVAVATGEPVHVRTQAEIAAALTETLTRRMKPPREPRRDIRPSTAAWLFLTGLALAFLLVTLFSAFDRRWWVFGLGVAQVAFGYVWIVRLTGQRGAARGAACAVPPLTFVYLAQWKYAKFRPLRFVATGAVLAGVSFVLPHLRPTTRAWVSGPPQAPPAPAPNPASLSKLDQLRVYREQKTYDKLIELLQALARTDALVSADAKDRAAIAAELKTLCAHQDAVVKVAAMGAYARWGGDDALDICLTAVKSSAQEERLKALELLPQWKNSPAAPEVARVVSALVGRPGIESTRAKVALEEIGGPAAEQAALDLFRRSASDQTVQLVALNILEKVGGEKSVSALRDYNNKSLNQVVKTKAQETIEVIQQRK